MHLVEPGLRERLMERHRQVGPMSQYHDLKTIDAFDVRDRIATSSRSSSSCAAWRIRPNRRSTRRKSTNPCQDRIHQAARRGAFPPMEIPDKVNALIEEFVAAL